MDDTITVHQFAPAHAVAAYLRAAALPHRVVNSRYPEYASTGELPQLRHGRALAGGTRDCLAYLKEVSRPAMCCRCPLLTALCLAQLKDLDAHLTDAQAADCRAYCALLLGVLADVESWVLWVDPVHYAAVVWPLLSRTLLAPLRWVIPGTVRRRHTDSLAHTGWADAHGFRAAALAAYDALATRLRASGGPFLFGDRITTADALLYGHLAAVRHALPGDWLSGIGSGDGGLVPNGGGAVLLRAYEALRHRLFEAEAGGDAHAAAARHLLGTTGPLNALEALDRAIDARRLHSAMSVHSPHSFTRTSNAPAAVAAAAAAGRAPSNGAAPVEAAAAATAAVSGGLSSSLISHSYSSFTPLADDPMSSSRLSLAGGGDGVAVEGGTAADPSGAALSVQRWGFGVEPRMLERAVAAVQKQQAAQAGLWGVASDLLFAAGMAALAIAAVRSATR